MSHRIRSKTGHSANERYGVRPLRRFEDTRRMPCIRSLPGFQLSLFPPLSGQGLSHFRTNVFNSCVKMHSAITYPADKYRTNHGRQYEDRTPVSEKLCTLAIVNHTRQHGTENDPDVECRWVQGGCHGDGIGIVTDGHIHQQCLS